jgi:SAM-dependent methyltransferase
MKRLGHNVLGVDFDPTSLKLARQAGIEVLTPDQLVSSGYQGRFDLITLAHVIEHVADPVELLRILRRFLRPGGLLYLETPNSEAAGLTILGRYWRGLEAPRHLSIPNRAALEQALHASGFVDVDYYVRGSVRGWLWGESLDAMPSHGKERTRRLLAKAPKENGRNCEFLTLMAKAGG